MFLSRECEMGVRGVLHLALHGGERGMTPEEIGGAQHISSSYLSKVFHRMERAQILKQMEDGRFRLARAPRQISIRALVESFNVPLELTRCLVHHDRIHPCGEVDRCELYALWKELSASILKTLESHTLADMIEAAVRDHSGTVPPSSVHNR